MISDHVVHQLGDQRKGQLFAHVEPHMRQLEADVGIQLARRNFVQHVVIELGTVLSLVGVGDVLAQVIDADARAPLVHLLGGTHGVGQLRSGNEAA